MQLGKYKHYKGQAYEVLWVAKHSETLEDLVVYRALYDSQDFGNNALRVRPQKMFLENILVDGKEVKRFMYMGE